MTQQLIYHVMQDGPDFYIHSDAEGENLLMTRHYPHHVKDWDMEAAVKAREWFLGLLNAKSRATMKWIG